jgi:hypothetical protein
MFKKVIRHPETGEIQGIETPDASASGALAAATQDIAQAIREVSQGISPRPALREAAVANLPTGDDGFRTETVVDLFREAVELASAAYAIGMDAGVREAASALGAEKGSVILKTVPDVRPQLAEMLIEAVREGIAERAELRDAAA